MSDAYDDVKATFVPPDHLVCPITLEVMDDPVICADGITYERSAITKWLEKHSTSPKTNLQLTNKTLIPNLSLKIAIAQMKQDHPNWDSVKQQTLEVEERQCHKVEAAPAAVTIECRDTSGDSLFIKINDNASISIIRRAISLKRGFTLGQITLLYDGRKMYDDKLLRDYNVDDYDIVDYIASQVGC